MNGSGAAGSGVSRFSACDFLAPPMAVQPITLPFGARRASTVCRIPTFSSSVAVDPKMPYLALQLLFLFSAINAFYLRVLGVERRAKLPPNS